jgi:hypothetical protein
MRDDSGAGWCVPLSDHKALASRILALAADRDEIIRHAHRARAYAGLHDFHTVFQTRFSHLAGKPAR